MHDTHLIIHVENYLTSANIIGSERFLYSSGRFLQATESLLNYADRFSRAFVIMMLLFNMFVATS